MCKVAVCTSEEKTRVAYTTPASEIVVLDQSFNILQRISTPHNDC